jgi:ArsR family transcriptional regulator
LKILGEPNRLRILTSLGLECRPVTSIVKDTGLSQTNVSFHLRVLRDAGLVRAERCGSFIYYCLPDSQLREIIDQFRDWEAVIEGDSHATEISWLSIRKERQTWPCENHWPP